jgi:hypothetical protein
VRAACPAQDLHHTVGRTNDGPRALPTDKTERIEGGSLLLLNLIITTIQGGQHNSDMHHFFIQEDYDESMNMSLPIVRRPKKDAGMEDVKNAVKRGGHGCAVEHHCKVDCRPVPLPIDLGSSPCASGRARAAAEVRR